ncbi:hypothetical protein GQ55_7G245900 [Panicum hallii var. hallii]|uniref:Uncharacterized protein n=1 Tax=Panicum hallii var. hallii TaxID=1504633 RepID=A0A2T7CYN2_9POAL|nr:hypothetical protein GQ55_7G245900 [Panicum hallii var. hallii]
MTPPLPRRTTATSLPRPGAAVPHPPLPPLPTPPHPPPPNPTLGGLDLCSSICRRRSASPSAATPPPLGGLDLQQRLHFDRLYLVFLLGTYLVDFKAVISKIQSSFISLLDIVILAHEQLMTKSVGGGEHWKSGWLPYLLMEGLQQLYRNDIVKYYRAQPLDRRYCGISVLEQTLLGLEWKYCLTWIYVLSFGCKDGDLFL